MIRLRLPLDNEKMLSLRSLVLPAPIVPVIMSNDSIAHMIIEAGTMVGETSLFHSSSLQRAQSIKAANCLQTLRHDWKSYKSWFVL